MSKSLNRILHWIGGLLGVIGVIFVIERLSRYSAQIDIGQFNATTWLAVAVFAVVYGVANLLLAFAWWHLLIRFRARMPWRWVVSVYGISQLAKYVPGNVFQFAGRQAMGMVSGVQGGALAKSIMWELTLLCAAGAMYGLLDLPLIFRALPIWVGYGLFILAIGVTAKALNVWQGRPVMWAFFNYLGFLAVSGSLFACLVSLLARPLVADAPIAFGVFLCAAFVVAWLTGLVTPGAPAGVGIRELVLLFLLKGIVTETDLVLAVALGRIVTIIGDLIYFFVATLIKRSNHNEVR